MINRAVRSFLPVTLFIIVALLLLRGLHLDPRKIPSVLIDHTVPNFSLATLTHDDQQFSQDEFIGKVSLLNVWASWCPSCLSEHQVLLDIAKSGKVVVYGMDYKDDPNDAKRWLKEHGNPFRKVAYDGEGDVAIDWGVYGTPETFIIDKEGVICYKHIGAITRLAWKNKLLPLIENLKKKSV